MDPLKISPSLVDAFTGPFDVAWRRLRGLSLEEYDSLRGDLALSDPIPHSVYMAFKQGNAWSRPKVRAGRDLVAPVVHLSPWEPQSRAMARAVPEALAEFLVERASRLGRPFADFSDEQLSMLVEAYSSAPGADPVYLGDWHDPVARRALSLAVPRIVQAERDLRATEYSVDLSLLEALNGLLDREQWMWDACESQARLHLSPRIASSVNRAIGAGGQLYAGADFYRVAVDHDRDLLDVGLETHASPQLSWHRLPLSAHDRLKLEGEGANA